MIHSPGLSVRLFSRCHELDYMQSRDAEWSFMLRLASVLSWLLPFALLVFAIVVVPLRMLDEQGLPRYQALRSELHEVRDGNKRMRRQVQDLKRSVNLLRSDPETIERIARDELGMLRNGELLFQFSN